MTRAFTLIELLVVVTIIVVLLALLTPALDKALAQAERAVCAANQRGINSAAMQYAVGNKNHLFICRGREVEATFVTPVGGPEYSGKPEDGTVDWLKAMASVGLTTGPENAPTGQNGVAVPTASYPLHRPGKMWFCPSSSYEGYWDAGWRQYWTSTQYYGGIETWRSELSTAPEDKTRPSRSPVRTTRSRGGWVLTSDRSILFNSTAWSDGGFAPYWGDNPNHKSDEHPGPAGNNQSYTDGSADWVDGKELVNIHSYRDGGRQVGFFFQQDTGGWKPPDTALAETYMKN